MLSFVIVSDNFHAYVNATSRFDAIAKVEAVQPLGERWDCFYAGEPKEFSLTINFK